MKSLAEKVARKAASAAVLGAISAGQGHGDGPATEPVAAVATVAGDAHLTTTYHHPFYDETQSAFVEAKDLEAGDVLQTPTGTAQVTGVRLYHADTTTYDLTIGSLHTYYVEAGHTLVLVHNDSCPIFKGTHPIITAQKRSNVGFRYQEHATGTDEEQWWQHNGELTKVDAGPDENGWIVEAKWAGNDSPTGWDKSLYNPMHAQSRFNEDTAVARRGGFWI